MISKQFFSVLLKKEQVAKDTFSFYFSRPADYDFLPGQYNQVTLPIIAADGRGSSRFFTIASSPLEKEYIMITTKIGQSDFKKKFFSLSMSEQIQFLGPTGGFILQDTDIFNHVFLASGIGITVFRSMITYVAKKKLPITITLFVAFSAPEDIIYYEQLTRIASENHNIKIIYTVTHPDKSREKWNGETGKITEALINRYVTDSIKPIYYIVGPQVMVDGTEELLERMGIEEGRIKIEEFTGY